MKNLTTNNINKLIKTINENNQTTTKNAYYIACECLTNWKKSGFKNANEYLNAILTKKIILWECSL